MWNAHDQSPSRMMMNDGVESTFRTRRGYRLSMLVCLVLFVLIGIGSAWGMWIDAPPDRRIHAVVLVTLFWSAWAGFCVFDLLVCCRETLTIRGGRIIRQGPFGDREADLSKVTKVRWKFGSDGSITVKEVDSRITIHLGRFDPEERLWLIRYFREVRPDSLHEGWEQFCRRIAISLRDHDPHRPPKPGPDEVVVTRRRWDWYFLPMVVFAGAYGIIAFWAFNQPRMLTGPLLPMFFWLMFRSATPKQGFAVRRIDADTKRFLLFLLWWLVGAIAGLLAFSLIDLPMPYNIIAGTLVFLFWLFVLLWKVNQMERPLRIREREVAKVAAQQWESGEVVHQTKE